MSVRTRFYETAHRLSKSIPVILTVSRHHWGPSAISRIPSSAVLVFDERAGILLIIWPIYMEIQGGCLLRLLHEPWITVDWTMSCRGRSKSGSDIIELISESMVVSFTQSKNHRRIWMWRNPLSCHSTLNIELFFWPKRTPVYNKLYHLFNCQMENSSYSTVPVINFLLNDQLFWMAGHVNVMKRSGLPYIIESCSFSYMWRGPSMTLEGNTTILSSFFILMA